MRTPRHIAPSRPRQIDDDAIDTQALTRLIMIVVGVGWLAAMGLGAWLWFSAPDRPASDDSGYSRTASTGSTKSGNFFFEWLRFGRARQDGESAEDWVYAHCRMSSALAANGGVLFGAPGPRPKVDAAKVDRDCREWASSSNAKWVKPEKPKYDGKPVNPWVFKPL
ncbi:MAG: hypothetical protein KGP27_16645 [Hyphomicrobiales bacterium]|nr:hypothetical protein [Hyphomicrobiales bacterium]